MKRNLLAAIACLLFGLAVPAWAGHPNCAVSGGTLLTWPAPSVGAPIWEMCWLPPSASSGPRGSGLEVRDVWYKGIQVAKRMHAPILFAEYRGVSTCYRDWKDTNAPFAAVSEVRNKLGVIPAGGFSSTTTCDVSTEATASHGTCPFTGLSPNPFTSASCLSPGGVSIEDHTDYVLLTTQYSASWYQYTSRIAFYTKGDIAPEFGFGNSNGTNNSLTHWHHNYWRFDFDIDGADHDEIDINSVPQLTEFSSLRSLTGGDTGGPTTWTVTDTVEGFGYKITPGADDYTPANESTRNFHSVDVIGSRFINNEYTDTGVGGSNSLNDCTMHVSNLVNSESIADTDVVLYYRASVRDTTANNWPTSGAGAIPQDSMVCKRVGPMITQVGDWPIFRDGYE